MKRDLNFKKKFANCSKFQIFFRNLIFFSPKLSNNVEKNFREKWFWKCKNFFQDFWNFEKYLGLSPLKRSKLNALPTEILSRNHSMKKNTQNGNLSHISRMAPHEVNAHDVVQQHETIVLPQLNLGSLLFFCFCFFFSIRARFLH